MVQTSSLFNEISPSVSFPAVAFFSFLFLRWSHTHTLCLSLFLPFLGRFCSSFPNIFARIDDESQPAGKYTSLLNKTLSGLGTECTARINGRESSRRGYIWEKCRERIVRMYRSSRQQPWILSLSLSSFTLRFHAHLLFSYSQVSPQCTRDKPILSLLHIEALEFLEHIAIKPCIYIIKNLSNYSTIALYIIGNRMVELIRLVFYSLNNFFCFS